MDAVAWVVAFLLAALAALTLAVADLLTPTGADWSAVDARESLTRRRREVETFRRARARLALVLFLAGAVLQAVDAL